MAINGNWRMLQRALLPLTMMKVAYEAKQEEEGVKEVELSEKMGEAVLANQC